MRIPTVSASYIQRPTTRLKCTCLAMVVHGAIKTNNFFSATAMVFIGLDAKVLLRRIRAVSYAKPRSSTLCE